MVLMILNNLIIAKIIIKGSTTDQKDVKLDYLKNGPKTGVIYIIVYMRSFYTRRYQKCKKLLELTVFLRFWDLLT